MTKTNTRSRIVGILLVLVMLLTMVPITGVTANAAEDDTSYAQAEVRDYDTFASYLRSYDSRDLKLIPIEPSANIISPVLPRYSRQIPSLPIKPRIRSPFPRAQIPRSIPMICS